MDCSGLFGLLRILYSHQSEGAMARHGNLLVFPLLELYLEKPMGTTGKKGITRLWPCSTQCWIFQTARRSLHQ